MSDFLDYQIFNILSDVRDTDLPIMEASRHLAMIFHLEFMAYQAAFARS